MNQIKIGEFIKSLRKAKGLSQQQVADELFVTQKTVSRWETGESIPDISILKDVAKFFDISVDELLDGERNNKEQSNSTTKRKEFDRTNLVTNKIVNSINIFSLIGLSIYGLLLIIGLILLFTVDNEVSTFILSIVGAISCFIIYLIGYKNNKSKINSDLEYINKESIEKQIRLKTLLFSDIYTLLNVLTLCLNFFIIFIYYKYNLSTLLTIVNFLCLIFILIISYILFRPFIKNGKISKANLYNTLHIIFSVCMISLILFFIESKSCQNETNGGSMGFYAESSYFPSLLALSLDGAKTYVFRIISIILVLSSIGGILYFTKKNKFLLTFIISVIGIIGSFFSTLDHYFYRYLTYSLVSRFDEIGFIILFIAIGIAITNFIIYIKHKKEGKIYE